MSPGGMSFNKRDESSGWTRSKSASNDRAVEVLAEALRGYDLHAATRVELAGSQVEALASVGFQITDLTPEEARALLRATGDGRLLDLEVSETELSGAAKLRVLASSPSGEETRERNEER